MISRATVVSARKIFPIGLLFLLCLPYCLYAQEKLFDETLNALPDSVLFSTSDYEVSEITHFTAGVDDDGYDDQIEFSSYGDLDGDGDPEIVLSAWDYTNCVGGFGLISARRK